MFSVPKISSFSAGQGISAVESRVRHLESMLNQMEAGSLPGGAPPSLPIGSVEAPSFKSYIQGASPVPLPVSTQFMSIQGGKGPSESRRETFRPLIQTLSEKHGVDPHLVEALVQQESGFNPKAVSRVGAQGLMQLMPQTAKGLGVTNPLDPIQNLDGGIRYLKSQLAKFNGNIPLALAAYNAGPGAVQKYQGVPPYGETQQYVRSVMAKFLSSRHEGAAS